MLLVHLLLDNVAPDDLTSEGMTFEQVHNLYKQHKGEEKADSHYKGLLQLLIVTEN